MSAPLTKTRYPGVCKRRSRYAFHYRDRLGKQRSRSARTIHDAGDANARMDPTGGRLEGERAKLPEWLCEWVARYQSRNGRGFREETRAEYRADLGRYAIRCFGPHVRVGDVDARAGADFITWPVKQPSGPQAPDRRALELGAQQAQPAADGVLDGEGRGCGGGRVDLRAHVKDRAKTDPLGPSMAGTRLLIDNVRRAGAVDVRSTPVPEPDPSRTASGPP